MQQNVFFWIVSQCKTLKKTSVILPQLIFITLSVVVEVRCLQMKSMYVVMSTELIYVIAVITILLI